jgi:glycosyltransferase involved in cell wall biosynthesis
MNILMRDLISIIARNGGVFLSALKARDVLQRTGLMGLMRALTRQSYTRWAAKYDTLDDEDRVRIRHHIASLKTKPLISIVMPVYNPDPKYFDETIQSVRSQLYPNWELCIADDASTNKVIRQIIDRHAGQDPRIRAVYRDKNGHICLATNSALELARGEFIALLDHDDILAEHALYWIASEIEKHPDVDILYTDSDLLDDSHQRFGVYFKSDFNLDLMLGHNMVSHLGVYRRSLIELVGGMRAGFEGSQDYDLLLRVLDQSALGRIRHIPAVLYHWRRSNKAPTYSMRNLDRCAAAAREAVKDFLESRNIDADIMPAPAVMAWQRIRYHLPDPAPKVSVIISAKNKSETIRKCVDGVLKGTDYPSLEVAIAVHNNDGGEIMTLLKELAKDPRVRILPYTGPFNSPAMNNFAAGNTNGEILAFLSDNIEITHAGWLREMVSQAVRPKTGAVGAKLYFPDGKIQHAGLILGMGGVAGHQYSRMPGIYVGRSGETILAHEMSAVTGACMVVCRSAFADVGGFNSADLPASFSDVDFCLRLRERGYRIIFTPFAELIHHVSASRGKDSALRQSEQFPVEFDYMIAHWGHLLERDPFYNLNLSLKSTTVDLAEPPRVSRPWESW